MPRLSSSGVKGLTKKHERGCPKPKRLERCDCNWVLNHDGVYGLRLHLWCREGELSPHDKPAAEAVAVRAKKAINDGEFDRAGERKTSSGGTSLADFIDEWWNSEVIDEPDEKAIESGEKGKRSLQRGVTYHLNIDGLKPEAETIMNGALGDRSLQDLMDDTEGIEQWLNATRKLKNWSGKTFNEYRRLLLFFFKRAVVRRKIKFNPIDAIKRVKGVNNQRGELRHYRMTREGLQQALLDACEKLNRTQCPNRNKLTQAKADAIRAAVERGTLQKDMATKYGVSATVVCQIVNGTIWNPARRVTTTKGNEQRRRVQGAFDLGTRAEELTRIQLQHVRWNEFRLDPEHGHKTYKIVLPAHLTKGGKTTGRDEVLYATDKDHCAMLEARREQFRNTTMRHTAYIYGTDNGYRVADFRKSWHANFEAAGLEYGVDFGRDVSVVWHTIKHEFASRAVETSPNLEVARDRTRHGDIKTMQRYVHTKEDAAWSAAMGRGKQR